jgi:hypothetical protein
MKDDWIYFEVDVDLGTKLVPDAKLEDYMDYYDARLFRTNGKRVQASFFTSVTRSIVWNDVTV